MKLIKITFISFFLFFYTLSFSQISNQEKEISKPLFNESALLQHVKTLSSDAFEGRRTGTEGALKTRTYIIKQFQLLNVLPLSKNYQQAFSFVNEAKRYKGINVLGVVKGTIFPDKYLVVSAHYDHEGIINGDIYNGADDNASGLSALFSFAEYFKNYPPKHSVILAAFDAEELGLQGAKFFVNNSIIPLKNIKVNINMDMISRSDVNELFAVGTRFDLTLKSIVLNTETPENLKLRTGHDGVDGEENWVYSSDHAAFHNKDIPFLYFGVEDHNDYHKPTDDYENIHSGFYINAVETIISIFQKIDTIQF